VIERRVAALGVAGLGDRIEELLDRPVVDLQILENLAGAGGRHPL